jgi:hypothetical protein
MVVLIAIKLITDSAQDEGLSYIIASLPQILITL